MTFVPPDLVAAEQIEAQRDLNRMREPTRIQMPLVDVVANFGRCVVFDSTGPLKLLNAAAHYRAALGKECGMGSGAIRGTDLRNEQANSQIRQYWLLPSSKKISIRPLIAGAVGFYFDDHPDAPGPTWCLEWAYVHPFERGERLLGGCRLAFEKAYGDFVCVGPFTQGGLAACRSLVDGASSRVFGQVI